MELFKILKCLEGVAVAAILGCFFWSQFYATLTCSWTGSERFKPEARIAFFADPQIEGDAKIYRHGFSGKMEVKMNDIYHSLIATAIHRLGPTHAVTLGDLFSNERLNQEEFRRRKDRLAWQFSSIFGSVPTINVTGNHDIGYGYMIREKYLRDFESVFGPSNSLAHIAGHIFCNVNGMTLEGAPEKLMNESWNQVDLCAEEAAKTNEPIILVTHMPLPNPTEEYGNCDHYNVRWNNAHTRIIEQNHVTIESAQKLLDKLHPVMVFAGHDHGGCSYNVDSDGTIPQYTVRSMMGDFRGNVQLLAIGHKTTGGYGRISPAQYAVSTCSIKFKMVHFVWIVGVSCCYLTFSLLCRLIATVLQHYLDKHEQPEDVYDYLGDKKMN